MTMSSTDTMMNIVKIRGRNSPPRRFCVICA